MTARTESEYWADIMGRREDAAAEMIGELCREGRPVHYINLRDRSGRLTGKTKEGSRHDLIGYLVRNRYA
jgi:hypothetical protein